MSSDQKPYFDAIIVVPLEEEFDIVAECFVVKEDLSNDRLFRLRVGCPGTDAQFLLVKQSTMGKTANREAFEWCLKDYDAGILVCVGIAGALSGDVAIGDVCYSGTIIDVTDNTKVSVNGDQKESISLSSRSYNTPHELTIPIMRNRLLPTSKAAHAEWATHCAQRARALIPGEFAGKKGLLERIAIPTARDGAIVCALVSGSPEYNKKLQGVERKVLAVETESGALSSIALNEGLPAITVRGISDYAGVDKNQFEIDTHNQARNVAVYNAATFLARQLSSDVMQEQFSKFHSKRDNGCRSVVNSETQEWRITARFYVTDSGIDCA
jgi:nucleoside phosphorylase